MQREVALPPVASIKVFDSRDGKREHVYLPLERSMEIVTVGGAAGAKPVETIFGLTVPAAAIVTALQALAAVTSFRLR